MSSGYIKQIRSILEPLGARFESEKDDVVGQIDDLIIFAVKNDRKSSFVASDSDTETLLSYAGRLKDKLATSRLQSTIHSKIVEDLIICVQKDIRPSVTLLELTSALHSHLGREGLLVESKILMELKQTANNVGLNTDDESQ